MAWENVVSETIRERTESISGIDARVVLRLIKFHLDESRIRASFRLPTEDKFLYSSTTPGITGIVYRAKFVGEVRFIYGDTTWRSVSFSTPSKVFPNFTQESFVYSQNEAFRIRGTMYIEKYVQTPPSTPSSITVPSTIMGGEKFTISWGTSTDPDGDPISYRLERSVNGGSFTQIYSGSGRSYTDTALSSRRTVAYRVRAYDGQAYSGYRTSPTRTIIHNTAPTTPPSITVPDLKSGMNATISWGASTDADGDTISYYLQRSVNGGSYSTIRSGGTSRNYIDSISKDWDTVTYMVRAYDGTVYSGYRTSSTITVKHFPEFNMKVNGGLKVSDNGWAKINGELREIESINIKINGSLKEV